MISSCQRILDNLSTAICLLNEDLRPCYLNPAAEMLLSVSHQRGQGFAIQELIPGNPEFIALLRQALGSGHPYTERERTLVVAGEVHLTIDCTVTPLVERDLEPLLLIEMTQVDRQLRIARDEQLLRQQSATRALLRGLAHEVKNPLGGLRGAAQLLERELPEARLREYTDVIIGEADRLTKLVDEMLGPNRPPRKQWINVHQVTERVRSLVSAEAPPGVVLEGDYDPSIPALYADADQLIQALLNIVRNGVQAVGEHGSLLLRSRTRRQCTIGQTRHKLVVQLEVIDNGPGIPSDLREQIFYPMVSGHSEGVGVGLSIAQSLVNSHHGLIECRSKPGETVFTLLLPLEPSDDRAW